MKILLLDTSQKHILIALAEGKHLITTATYEHVKEFVASLDSIVDALLQKSNTLLEDIDLFVVGIGPGSHTGLKIGIAYLSAIAQVEEKKIIGVPSSDDIREMLASAQKLQQEKGGYPITPIYMTNGL